MAALVESQITCFSFILRYNALEGKWTINEPNQRSRVWEEVTNCYRIADLANRNARE